MNIRRLTSEDIPHLREFWKENWGDEFVVAHGVIYHPDTVDGFVAFEGDVWVGEITYAFQEPIVRSYRSIACAKGRALEQI